MFTLVFSASAMAADRLPVYVSIVPQKYFVQQIGRDLGFAEVAFAPLVRSSYKAAELYEKVKRNRG